MSRAGADGHAQADLAGALGDGDEHDVHDADAADDERNRRDAQQQCAHQARGRSERLHHFGHIPDLEIVRVARLDAVPLVEQRRDLPDGGGDCLARPRGDEDLVDGREADVRGFGPAISLAVGV